MSRHASSALLPAEVGAASVQLFVPVQVVPPEQYEEITDTGMVDCTISIVSDPVVADTIPFASVACTVNADSPAIVGVPEIVHPEKLSPAGSVPVTVEQVNGAVPPAVVRESE